AAESDVATMTTPRLWTLNGSDVQHRDLTFAIITPTSHGTLGPVDNTPNDHATVSYLPATGLVGSDSFTFRATNGLRWSATVTFTITVGQPTAADQSVTTQANTPVSIRLQGSEPTGADLTFSTTAPAHGTLGPIDNTPLSSAVVVYTPNPGYAGTDAFSFTAATSSAA